MVKKGSIIEGIRRRGFRGPWTKKDKEDRIKKEQEETKKYFGGMVRALHDKYKPNYIFLAERSAIPSGYILKEIWNKAYPNEPLPKFYRINPGYMDSRALSEETSIPIEKIDKIIEKGIRNYFKMRIKKRNSNILVLDENASGSQYGSLFRASEIVREGLKEIGQMGRVEERGGLGAFHYEDISSFLPTTKLFGYASQNTISRKEEAYNKKERRAYLEKGIFTLAGGIAHKSLRPQAYQFVNELKQLGREAGEELHAEIEQEAQKKKSLEQKVSSVIAIAGLVSSFFLLSSSVTGNAIGNISQSSGSWLGIGLLLVGIAGALFWFRSKKR